MLLLKHECESCSTYSENIICSLTDSPQCYNVVQYEFSYICYAKDVSMCAFIKFMYLLRVSLHYHLFVPLSLPLPFIHTQRERERVAYKIYKYISVPLNTIYACLYMLCLCRTNVQIDFMSFIMF